MQISPYQQAIIDAARARVPTLVQACAGAGKTTTLRLIAQALPRSLSVACFAFNREISEEFKRKLPPHVVCSTLHSHGYSALKRAHPTVALDDFKLRNIIKAHAPGEAWNDLIQAVPVVMALMLDPADEGAILAGMRRCGRSLDEPDKSLPLVAKIINQSLEMHNFISYDEMIYFPLRFPSVPVPRFDVVLVDEAQDLNEAQQALVARTLKPGGTLIGVGDRKQAIYSFRGADPAAMDNMKERFGMKELRLPLSYRCPSSHVALAAQVAGPGIIGPAENAPEGTILHRQDTDQDRERTMREAQAGDLILCRMNAPLLPYALQLIRDGRKVVVRGRDIGGELVRIVEKQQAATLPQLVVKLEKWRQRAHAKAVAQDNEKAAEAVQDKFDAIHAVIDACDTEQAAEVVTRLGKIFSDDLQGVVFSSVHRAKGLEAQNVTILGPEMLPLVRKDSTPESLEQEKNLKYVALTRSRDRLTLQPLPSRRRRD